MFGVSLGIIDSGGAGGGGASFESIATATGTGSSGTITFSSIPSTYKHLQIRGIARTNDTGGNTGTLDLRLNGDSATNYSRHFLYGNGSTATATGAANTNSVDCGLHTTNLLSSGIMAAFIIDIHDYASTTKNKTVRVFSGEDFNSANTEARVYLTSGAWRSTSEVNSISLLGVGSFLTSTVFSLYGIKG